MVALRHHNAPEMKMLWERPIYQLHADLDSDGSSVPDDDARAVIKQIEQTLQTNCDSAAQYLFFAIAPICQHRPHLESELLLYPLRALYFLGINDGLLAASWLRSYLVNNQPYVGVPKGGVRWLERAASNADILQAAFSRVVAECSQK